MFLNVNTVNAQEVEPLQFYTLDAAKAELKWKIEEYIVAKALEYGVSPAVAVKVAECESNLNYLAVGDKGRSFGLYQIHLPAHPTVTKEQALDPIFAVNWALPRLKDTPKIWTCFRKIYL